MAEWEAAGESNVAAHSIRQKAERQVAVSVPADLLEALQLAHHARIGATFNEAVVVILRKGLAAVSEDVRQALMAQLGKLDGMGDRV